MKNITFLFILCLLLPFAVSAQRLTKNIQFIPESEVPAVVIQRQRELFPSDIVSQWQVQRTTGVNTANLRYIANLEKDGRPGFSVSYLPEAILLFTREIIPDEIIPNAVRLKVKKKYPKFNIEPSDFITLPSPHREIYIVKLRDDNRLLYVFYDTTGTEIDKKDLPAEIAYLIG